MKKVVSGAGNQTSGLWNGSGTRQDILMPQNIRGPHLSHCGMIWELETHNIISFFYKGDMMVSEYYKNAGGWGVFITMCIVILHVFLNAFYNHSTSEAPIPNWIFTGLLPFIISVGLFIYLASCACHSWPDSPWHKCVLVRIMWICCYFIAVLSVESDWQ